jgi:hemerythrin-like domain-containing protein
VKKLSGYMNAMGGMPTENLCAGLSQLKGEHAPLIEMLDGLFKLTERIAEEGELEKLFTRLKSDVSTFVAELDPHSEREEGVLFPMLGVYIGTQSGPIAAMEYEHEQAKSLINEFLIKAENTQLTSEERMNLSELVKNAYDVLIQHFSKEENVLFPMAERMLTDEEKEELYIRIQEIK